MKLKKQQKGKRVGCISFAEGDTEKRIPLCHKLWSSLT